MATNNGFASGELHGIDFLVNGRRSRTQRLTIGQKIAQLARTVNRAPEVMVKVSGGGKTPLHVQAHMDYITRNGKLDAINDQSEKVSGKEDVKELHDSWDLDASNGQGKYRQAFNIVLSMPAGTDPKGLFTAAQNFARERFYGHHQYMMVLHTPDIDPHKDAPPHPHVHLVVKAEGFDGKRLHIRKATLEDWRNDFAETLRAQGIEANATPRDIRGKTRKGKTAGMHYAEKRSDSTVTKNKFEEARQELMRGDRELKPWELAIIKQRQAVVRSLISAANELRRDGDETLATSIEHYAKELPRLETERHQMKRAIVERVQRKTQELSQERNGANENNEKER